MTKLLFLDELIHFKTKVKKRDSAYIFAELQKCTYLQFTDRSSKTQTTFIPCHTNYDYGADYQSIKTYFHMFSYYVIIYIMVLDL